MNMVGLLMVFSNIVRYQTDGIHHTNPDPEYIPWSSLHLQSRLHPDVIRAGHRLRKNQSAGNLSTSSRSAICGALRTVK